MILRNQHYRNIHDPSKLITAFNKPSILLSLGLPVILKTLLKNLAKELNSQKQTREVSFPFLSDVPKHVHINQSLRGRLKSSILFVLKHIFMYFLYFLHVA